MLTYFLTGLLIFMLSGSFGYIIGSLFNRSSYDTGYEDGYKDGVNGK